MNQDNLRIGFDERGLVPVVVQDAASGQVLMVAWMNEQALRLTQETGQAHFWSRSRGELWHKGATSGNVMRVLDLRVDCDADTLLLQVDPAGPACHTGERSCFFRRLGQGEERTRLGVSDEPAVAVRSTPVRGAPSLAPTPTSQGSGEPQTPSLDKQRPCLKTTGLGPDLRRGNCEPQTPLRGNYEPIRCSVLHELFTSILDRQANPRPGSYTARLLEAGEDEMLKKVGEEAMEVILAAKGQGDGRLVSEAADLLYHLLVLLAARGLTLADVEAELLRRRR